MQFLWKISSELRRLNNKRTQLEEATSWSTSRQEGRRYVWGRIVDVNYSNAEFIKGGLWRRLLEHVPRGSRDYGKDVFDIQTGNPHHQEPCHISMFVRDLESRGPWNWGDEWRLVLLGNLCEMIIHRVLHIEPPIMVCRPNDPKFLLGMTATSEGHP